MDSNAEMKKVLSRAVALGLAMTWGGAGAADIYLCAGTADVTLPGGGVVPMWGYAVNADGVWGANCSNSVQVPGPLLSVPVADTTLTVHLQNHLPQPTSLVIPGQMAAMTPTFVTDAQNRERVMSLTHETAPGALGTYTWSNVQPGSYVYHSGSHMAVQVQMGLYGGMRKDFGTGMAYDGVAYSQEINLFYSEVDPALHTAVNNGTYGSSDPNNPGPTSTLNYQPRYFLVKAMAQDGTEPPPVAVPGQNTLLRMYNMGLRTVVPSVLNQHVALVAEDGNPYPYPRRQYSVMLAAGKTRDAIFAPAEAGTYAVFEGRTGPYSLLQVAAVGGGAVSATNDSYTLAEDGTLNVPAPGVLANDSGTGLSALLFENVTQGTLALAADGSFIYTPSANFSGTAQFRYQASDGLNTSAPATVAVTVTPVNDAPVAVADVYSTTQDTPLAIAAPGVLANDTDSDSATISVNVASVVQPANGSVAVAANGGFSYTPNTGFTGSDSFTYIAQDDLGAASAAASVTIEVAAAAGNQPPLAVDDYVTTKARTEVTIPVLENDTDPDGNIDTSTVSIVKWPNAKRGNSLTVNPDGTVTFAPGPSFRGSDTFEYTVTDTEGAVSNVAIVQVDVVK